METAQNSFQFSLAPGSKSEIVYQLLPLRRGEYSFGQLTVRYQSFLGLFWRQTTFDLSKTIKVYSDLQNLQELSFRLASSRAQGEFHQKRGGHGTDFASLREYTVGDPSDKIDWKATARRDRPIVRNYETEQEQRLLILVDGGRMMTSNLNRLSRFDYALNAALALALTGLNYNDQVGFGIFADTPLCYVPPRRGRNHLKNILASTFAITPAMVEPDYVGSLSYFASAQKGRCLIVLFTDLTDPLGSKILLEGLSSLSRKHLVMCVTLVDKQIITVANRRLSTNKTDHDKTIQAIFEKAVASDLLAQRELALSVLKQRGCLILDCPPEELSTKVVNNYLQIKARNSL
jgi:uncharacterized protein (DUF58 family)